MCGTETVAVMDIRDTALITFRPVLITLVFHSLLKLSIVRRPLYISTAVAVEAITNSARQKCVMLMESTVPDLY